MALDDASAAVAASTTEQKEFVPVVFSLTEFEEQQFFPTGIKEAFPVPFRIERPGRYTQESWLDHLTTMGAEVLVSCWRTPSLRAAVAADRSLPLKYVCHLTGSVRSLVPRELLMRGLQVTNWGGLASATVAEHALLLTLAALRNIAAWPEVQRIEDRVEMETQLDARTLFGRRVGLHGFGQAARALVGLLKPFGVPLSAYSEGVPAKLMTDLGVAPAPSLAALFAESEILIECEALTPGSRGTVNADIIGRLPAGAVFVNVGRAAVVDDSALLAAASSGRIRVALDVLSREPQPADSPWLQVRGAIFSPHIGGPTKDRYPDCGTFALANLRRYFARQPLEALITPEIYDRST